MPNHSPAQALAIRRGVATKSITSGVGYSQTLSHPLKAEYASLPPDAAALKALEAKSANPLFIWQESVARGSATVATAVRCLAAYLRSLEGLKGNQVAQQVRADQAGRKLLRWLLVDIDRADETKYRRHLSDAMRNNTFLFELAYLLSEEGRIKFLWDWLEADGMEFDDPLTYTAHLPASEQANSEFAHKKWRATLFRAMIRARFHQAIIHRNKSGHHALEDFWTADVLRQRSPADSLQRTLALKPAMMEICNQLSSTYYSNTDPDQWDRFRKFVDSYGRLTAFKLFEGIADTDLTCARLDICHPTSPNLESTMRIVRAYPEQLDASSLLRQPFKQKRFERLLTTALSLAYRKRWRAEGGEIEVIRTRFLQECSPDLGQYRYRPGSEQTLIRRFRC
ncbi:hypothetical protein BST61_g10011 [Cercospora zeina]